MAQVRHRIGLAQAFTSAAVCYWLHIFPLVRRELRYWRSRAATIPDRTLRRLALEAYSGKWCNLEGAVAFAIFAPARYRSTVVRLLFTFQAAYDFADLVSELPCSDPIANGHQLHQPLLVALQERTAHPDYYLFSDLRKDDGYLEALTNSCREAFHRMPSRELVIEATVRAVQRIVVYQSLNHAGEKSRTILEHWSKQVAPERAGLHWWETSAACASSTTALALFSFSANSELTPLSVEAIERAYHPWIGSLHTLLDSLVDWNEDKLAGQPSLLDEYASLAELTTRMRMLVQHSRQSVRNLPRRRSHEVLLAGMIGIYLAPQQARSIDVADAVTGIRQEIGYLAAPTLAVLGVRRRTRFNLHDRSTTEYI